MHYSLDGKLWRFVCCFAWQLPDNVVAGVHARAPRAGGCRVVFDLLNLTALAVNWQQGCGGGGGLAAANFPEPATLSLLAFAGIGILRRRR